MTRLGDLCEFRYGKSLPEQMRRAGGIPVYGSNGIVGSHDESITEGRAIVVGRKGSVGAVHLSSADCWPIDTTYYIDKRATDVDLSWLGRALSTLRLHDLNKAAAVPGLARNDVYELKVFVPRIGDQRRIAAILDKADALRRKRKRALDLLDSLNHSIFLDIFGDPALNLRGYPIYTLRSTARKFSDGPFGSNLKSCHYVDEGIRVIRLQNIGVGSFIDEDKAYVSQSHARSLGKHICLPGDILVGTLGDPNLRACLQPAWLHSAINKADCVQFRADPSIALPEYLVALLNQPSTEKLAQSIMLGQTRTRISMGRLRDLEVPIASICEQAKFVAVTNTLGALRSKVLAQGDRENHLFASLLHRAFSGQL